MKSPTKKERVFFEQIGEKRVSVYGYSVDALLVHLKEHNDKYIEECRRLERLKGNDPAEIHRKAYEVTWCDPACLAKTFDRMNCKENRQKARTRFSAGYTRLLTRYEKVLLKEYEPQAGYLIKAKLFDPAIPGDQAYADQQFEKAVERGDVSQTNLEKFAKVIGVRYGVEREPQSQPPAPDQPAA